MFKASLVYLVILGQLDYIERTCLKNKRNVNYNCSLVIGTVILTQMIDTQHQAVF